MRKGIAFKNRNGITDPFSTFDYEAANPTCGIHAQSSCVHNRKRLDFEVLKHYFCHSTPFFFGIERRVGHQYVDIFGIKVQFIEYVTPYLLHIIPVCDESPLNGLIYCVSIPRLYSSISESVGCFLFFKFRLGRIW